MGLMCLALTLTNCQKAQIEEVNPSPEANFELFASPAVATDAAITRTTIDGLATKWATGDQINIFHALAGSTAYTNDKAFTLKDAATGSFSGTVGALDGGSYDWYAFYPYTSQITTPANTSAGWVVVGGKTHQAQIQNGNNSRTHLSGGACPLFGIAKAVESSAVPSIEMNHLTSIIKVQVTNNSSEDLKVENVSFTGTEDIVGTYYINFAASPVGYKPRGNQYVSNTASLEVKNGEVISSGASADFYIAVKPFTAKTGTTLKLAVNGYEKTLTLKNDITFTAGNIKTLRFNVDKKIPKKVWTIVTDASTLAAGDKIVIVSNSKGKVAAGIVDDYLNETFAQFSSDLSTVESMSADASVFTLGGSANSWTLSNSDGALLGATAAKKLAFNKGTTSWKITISESDDATIQNGNNSYGKILYNVNSTRFSTYTSATNVSMLLPQIYRLESALPALATPTVDYEIQNLNSIFVMWSQVEGAKDYTVTCGAQSITLAGTEHTFTDLAYSTNYTVSVVANPTDASVNAPSAAGTTTATTGANPAGEQVKYTVNTASSVNTSGVAPSGSSVTFKNTYSTKDQMTQNNSQTYTLKGYDGKVIKKVVLSMHSNKSRGAGTFSLTAGSNTLASISSATNFNKWYDNTSYSQDYKDVNVTMTNDSYVVGANESVVLTITATTSSLYCRSVTIFYE